MSNDRHSHNPHVTVTGCPGCDEAIAKMSPVEQAMINLRRAANEFREAWDWHFECVHHLGRGQAGPEAVIVQQSERNAEARDRDLGEAAERYALARVAAERSPR